MVACPLEGHVIYPSTRFPCSSNLTLNPFNRITNIINQYPSLPCGIHKLVLELDYGFFIVWIINMAAYRVQSLISFDAPFMQPSRKHLHLRILLFAMPPESVN
ncbi:MAG: hypothetical protein DCF24_02550 [Cyanobium sp.]|nr:MAG: hypothetical protein DCF24_02550 [Cyanobium sp.]